MCEMIGRTGLINNRHVPVFEGDRREGDCTKLVSDAELAFVELGWEPKRSSLQDMITDAWHWHQSGDYEK